eukprot:scaffold26940_cov117-Phaeocystis_antarctica.AAC.7
MLSTRCASKGRPVRAPTPNDQSVFPLSSIGISFTTDCPSSRTERPDGSHTISSSTNLRALRSAVPMCTWRSGWLASETRSEEFDVRKLSRSPSPAPNSPKGASAAADVDVGREREPVDVEVARTEVPHKAARLKVVRARQLQEARACARVSCQCAALRVQSATGALAPHAANVRPSCTLALTPGLAATLVLKVEADFARVPRRGRGRRDAQQRLVVK